MGIVPERRTRMVELVRAHSELEVTTLARELQATEATVRRDLRALEEQGVVRRSYGMVFAVEQSRFEVPLSKRADAIAAEEEAIARTAVALLGDATSVYIDVGTAPRAVAGALPAHVPLTIVTPSIPVAAALATSPHEVLLLGGRIQKRTLSTVDHWARETLSRVTIDTAFLTANGVTPEAGLTTPDPAVAGVKTLAVHASRRRIFVGDHLKFGVTSFARFAAVTDIEVFVTGSRLPIAQSRRFGELGARIVRAQ